jgi:hypothetical protein
MIIYPCEEAILSQGCFRWEIKLVSKHGGEISKDWWCNNCAEISVLILQSFQIAKLWMFEMKIFWSESLWVDVGWFELINIILLVV